MSLMISRKVFSKYRRMGTTHCLKVLKTIEYFHKSLPFLMRCNGLGEFLTYTVPKMSEVRYKETWRHE